MIQTDFINLKLQTLSRSRFRSSFRLSDEDIMYIKEKGLAVIRSHAVELISKRLAPAAPVKDGKQTPFKGHPVFIAQHATATCCRKCLEKWHKIPKGTVLRTDDITYVINVIEAWIKSGL